MTGKSMDDVRTYNGILIADLVLPQARSLKDRRGPLRSLCQKLRNQDFAVAQVGPADLRQRVFLAVSAVSSSDYLLEALLDHAERLIFTAEFEVADLRRKIEVDSFYSG